LLSFLTMWYLFLDVLPLTVNGHQISQCPLVLKFFPLLFKK
jgi:hypothetical protein